MSMPVIGITGSFGTGKSTVASMLRELGATVIDADSLAHKALRKDSGTYHRIVKAFGRGILAGNGRIDRKALARKIFASPKNVRKLNAIAHPFVIAKIKDLLALAGKRGVLVVDAPLLLEARLDNLMDRIIVVSASIDKQVERSMKNFGLNEEEVKNRIKHQLSLKRKMEKADYVIDNNGSRADTRKQVERIWRRLKWR